MGEEEGKVESVLSLGLSLEEIDNLLLGAYEDLSDKAWHMLNDKRELTVERIRQKARDSKSPRDAIKAILEIPSEEDLGEEMVASGEISVRILFARAEKHLSADEVELVGKVVERMYPDGKGLGDEPWKGLLFANAKKFFPDDIEGMVKAMEKAGISKGEYVQVMLACAIEILKDDERLTRKLIERMPANNNIVRSFIKIVTYADEHVNHGSQIHGKRFLQIGDTLLSQGSINTACDVYKALIEEQNLPIGQARVEILDINNKFRKGPLTWNRMTKRIKGVIRKYGLNIKIE